MARVAGDEIGVVFRERISLRPGDVIRLGVKTGSEHLFDAATGRRLAEAG